MKDRVAYAIVSNQPTQSTKPGSYLTHWPNKEELPFTPKE